MKHVTAEELRKIAFEIDSNMGFDEPESVYFYRSSNRKDWFSIRPCQNGWHIEFRNNLLSILRTDFCVPEEDIFNIVDKQELINSMLEVVNRNIRMARQRVEQFRKAKKQLI